MPGVSLPYVQPQSFDVAYGHLIASVTSVTDKGIDRGYNKLFIDGPSGSGKTRVVWELYRRLKEDVTMGKIHSKIGAVSYVFINLTDSFLPQKGQEENSAIEKHIAKQVIAQLTNLRGQVDVSLEGVLRRLFGEKKGALVLHIDEFHRQPDETARLLSVVRSYSSSGSAPAVILPVCSGLFMHPNFDPHKVSSVVQRVPLGFFRDHQKTWEIVRGAGLVVANSDALRPVLEVADLSKTPRNVQYMVEDTAGWVMAAVQLGVNIPIAANLNPNVRASDLGPVEDAVVAKLKSLYPVSVLKDGFGGSSEEALIKIVTLALSPFPVR
jgi:hypothetical protein